MRVLTNTSARTHRNEYDALTAVMQLKIDPLPSLSRTKTFYSVCTYIKHTKNSNLSQIYKIQRGNTTIKHFHYLNTTI